MAGAILKTARGRPWQKANVPECYKRISTRAVRWLDSEAGRKTGRGVQKLEANVAGSIPMQGNSRS